MRFLLLLFKSCFFLWAFAWVLQITPGVNPEKSPFIFRQLDQIGIIFRVALLLLYTGVSVVIWRKINHWEVQLLGKNLFSFNFQDTGGQKLLNRSVLLLVLSFFIVYVAGTSYHIIRVMAYHPKDKYTGDF